MSKDDTNHGALHEAVTTLKEGHVRLEGKIDGFREAIFVKDSLHNEKRENRDKEVDAKFAKVDIKLLILGITSTISPFVAGGVLYPQKAAELISTIYHFFV